MPYSVTTWVEGVTTLGPTNLNKIETELARLKTTSDLSATAAIALSQLADPGSGNVVTSAGAGAVAAKPPGYEYGYTEFTADVAVTATTAATANTIVTAPAVVFDGTTIILVEFFCYTTVKGTTQIAVDIYDGATGIGTGAFQSAGAVGPCRFARRLTPSAASHTYSIRAYVDAGSGIVAAGAGGAGARLPGYIRVTKV